MPVKTANPNKAPTLSDVARQAGVGTVTVSAVLNGSRANTRVSEATRQRIVEAAAALQYHPNAAARSLRSRRTNTLGVLFGRVRASFTTNPYASQIFDGILRASSEAQLDVHVYTKPWQDAAHSAARFRDRTTDGLVVVLPFTDSDMVPSLTALEIPLVVIAWRDDLTPVPWVDVDNAAGARLAVQHLIDLGHRRIAHLSGDENYASAFLRREGYLQTMQAAGLIVPSEYIQPCSYRGHGGEKAINDLLSLPNPPTAAFCANDAIANRACAAVRERGLGVPQQFSVVGFNGIPGYRGESELTTICEPLQEIGEAAAKRVISLIDRRHGGDGGEMDGDRPILIAPELLVRGTTGPAPQQ